jgi:hypothetical protein
LIEQISLVDGVAEVITSLLSDRLALLVGAGLSMAAPASLPSAAALAAKAKQSYDATYGATRPPLAADIEEQAEYFFRRGELATVYLRTLIDKDAFAGQPNPGHYAVADLLLVRAIQTAVTTNVDTLIETAGQMLLGQIGAGIDAHGVAGLPPDTAPLLKIHGCRAADLAHTVWAPSQLADEPVASRITGSAVWLSTRLANQDLLIVGYWTDWDYLNAVLSSTLGAVNPARVIIVDPADGESFETKAPALFALGNRAAVNFRHVCVSGSEFLAALRREFSKVFIRLVLNNGSAEYTDLYGHFPDPTWTEPPDLDNDALWRIRRDLEGRKPTEPAKERVPIAGPLLGLTLLQLRAAGATPEDSLWVLNGTRVRVLRAEGKVLHRVEAEFERETAPVVAPAIVIAVGAETFSLPPNIARVGTAPTIARGNPSRWMTRQEAAQELNL